MSPLHFPMTNLCGQAPDAMRSTASALQLLTVSLGKCVQAHLICGAKLAALGCYVCR